MRRTAKGHPLLVRALCIGGVLLAGLAGVLGLSLEHLTRKGAELADGNRSDSSGNEALPVSAAEAIPQRVVEGRFKQGMTLAKLLEELKLPPHSRTSLLDAAGRAVNLRRLPSGLRWQAQWGSTGIERLVLEGVRAGAVLELRFEGERVWIPLLRDLEERRVERALAGVMRGALESSVVAVDGPAVLAHRIADLLAWDLDANRDLHRGDRFEVLYEEVWRDGQARRFGEVLALRWTPVSGKPTVEYGRFRGAHYDATCRPAKRPFLRSPLPIFRVSSGFSHRRLHPVLGVYRPHLGIDLRAPHGTPVRATADGTVLAAGWEGSGGNTVRLRHANGYLTAYLHLSGFAPGMAPGRRVVQGEIVGYVGATGLASAPHLDYRVQHQGRWIDPLTLPAERGSPLAGADLEACLDHYRQLWARYDSVSRRLNHLAEQARPVASSGALPPAAALAP